jgi:hypothetical protein
MLIIKEKKLKKREVLTLKWFDPDWDILKNIDSHAQFTDSQQYLKELPNSYVRHISPQNDYRINLAINTEQEVILLFTVEGLDSFYLIYQSMGRTDFIWSNEYEVKFGEYNIRLIFHSNEHNDSKGKLFKLKVKDWNDVEFTNKK